MKYTSCYYVVEITIYFPLKYIKATAKKLKRSILPQLELKKALMPQVRRINWDDWT